jgi:hypothetical protein
MMPAMAGRSPMDEVLIYDTKMMARIASHLAWLAVMEPHILGDEAAELINFANGEVAAKVNAIYSDFHGEDDDPEEDEVGPWKLKAV